MIFLTRTDPAKNINRFYLVKVAPDLFGEWSLLREWGRRGSPGTVSSRSFAEQQEAEKAAQRSVRRRLSHGYTSLAAVR